MTRPGGHIVVGEPYWRKEPEPAYLEITGMTRETFAGHYENVVTGRELVP